MNYDFGARHYDPRIGRWAGVDLLAETYENVSPYNYVANSPINNIDANGMDFSQGIPCPKWGEPGGGLFSAGANVLASFAAGLLGSLGNGPVALDKANAPGQQASLQSRSNITSSLNGNGTTVQEGGGDPGGKKKANANQGGDPPTYRLQHIIKDGIEQNNTPFLILFPVLKGVKTVWNLLSLVKEDPEAELQSIRELKNFKYDPRLENQTDLFHNFPRSLDKTIIDNAPWAKTIENGGNWFEYPGTIETSKKIYQGTYQIGINDEGVIFHRNFVPFK